MLVDCAQTRVFEHEDPVIDRSCILLYVFSAINQRNRMRTLEDAVEASKRELEESKNAKADPFTRRQCRPTLVTKVRVVFIQKYFAAL